MHVLIGTGIYQLIALSRVQHNRWFTSQEVLKVVQLHNSWSMVYRVHAKSGRIHTKSYPLNENPVCKCMSSRVLLS